MRFKLQRSKDPQQPSTSRFKRPETTRRWLQSETYVEKADAQHAINLIMNGAAGATVVDAT